MISGDGFKNRGAGRLERAPRRRARLPVGRQVQEYGVLNMGEAKAQREVMRKKMLEKSKDWDFPASPWEASVCASLRKEDVVLVRRASPEELAWARMPLNACHANARWYAKNDPTGRSRAVTGWWVQWPNFVLHSVVETNGTLICITPSAFNETEVPFIPDPKIGWVEDGEHYSAIRNGKIVGVGVRVYPAFTMALNAIVRGRLLKGGNPFEAGDFTDEEFEELKRKYIPIGEPSFGE